MGGVSEKDAKRRAPLPPEVADENQRVRWFRFACDVTFQRLHLEPMTLGEAREAVEELRRVAAGLFPGKGKVFDLVVAPRMERVIRERWGGQPGGEPLH